MCCCHALTPDRSILMSFVALPTGYLGYLSKPGAAEIAQHDNKRQTRSLLDNRATVYLFACLGDSPSTSIKSTSPEQTSLVC